MPRVPLRNKDIQKRTDEVAKYRKLSGEFYSRRATLIQRERTTTAQLDRAKAVYEKTRKDVASSQAGGNEEAHRRAMSASRKAENKYSELKSMLEEVGAEVKELTEGIDNAQTTIKRLETELAQDRALKEEIAQKKSQEVRLLTDRINDLKERQAKVRESLRASRDARDTHQRNAQDAEDAARDYKAKADSLKAQVEAGGATTQVQTEYQRAQRQAAAEQDKARNEHAMVKQEQDRIKAFKADLTGLVDVTDEAQAALRKYQS